MYCVIVVPEEFQFDPVTKSYGDPSRRPEVRTGTIEFIAPSEYMVSNYFLFNTHYQLKQVIRVRFRF